MGARRRRKLAIQREALAEAARTGNTQQSNKRQRLACDSDLCNKGWAGHTMDDTARTVVVRGDSFLADDEMGASSLADDDWGVLPCTISEEKTLVMERMELLEQLAYDSYEKQYSKYGGRLFPAMGRAVICFYKLLGTVTVTPSEALRRILVATTPHAHRCTDSPGKALTLPPDHDWNPAQQQEIEHTLSTTLSLIQGPLGTGKTSVLVAIIYCLVRAYRLITAGQLASVLGVGQSHPTVEIILDEFREFDEKFGDYAAPLEIIRSGNVLVRYLRWHFAVDTHRLCVDLAQAKRGLMTMRNYDTLMKDERIWSRWLEQLMNIDQHFIISDKKLVIETTADARLEEAMDLQETDDIIDSDPGEISFDLKKLQIARDTSLRESMPEFLADIPDDLSDAAALVNVSDAAMTTRFDVQVKVEEPPKDDTPARPIAVDAVAVDTRAESSSLTGVSVLSGAGLIPREDPSSRMMVLPNLGGERTPPLHNSFADWAGRQNEFADYGALPPGGWIRVRSRTNSAIVYLARMKADGQTETAPLPDICISDRRRAVKDLVRSIAKAVCPPSPDRGAT